jgi:hypothetical protein
MQPVGHSRRAPSQLCRDASGIVAPSNPHRAIAAPSQRQWPTAVSSLGACATPALPAVVRIHSSRIGAGVPQPLPGAVFRQRHPIAVLCGFLPCRFCAPCLCACGCFRLHSSGFAARAPQPSPEAVFCRAPHVTSPAVTQDIPGRRFSLLDFVESALPGLKGGSLLVHERVSVVVPLL